MNNKETFIYLMIHYQNLNDLMINGIYSPNSSVKNSNYVNIGDQNLISKRSNWSVPIQPGGVLHDYIPFYFCPRSPMLYIINKNPQIYKTPQSEIVYLVSSVERVESEGLQYVFTDGHAYMSFSKYFNQKSDLNNLDWNTINSNIWNDTQLDPDRSRRKQAEFLVFNKLPFGSIIHIGVYNQLMLNYVQSQILSNGYTLNVTVEKGWYY